MESTEIPLEIKDEKALAALAARIASLLETGDVVTLIGDLGAWGAEQAVFQFADGQRRHATATTPRPPAQA